MVDGVGSDPETHAGGQVWRGRPESIPEEVQNQSLRGEVLGLPEVSQAMARTLVVLVLVEGGVVEEEWPLMLELLVLVVRIKFRLLKGILLRVLLPTAHTPVHGRHRVILDPPSGVMHESGQCCQLGLHL